MHHCLQQIRELIAEIDACLQKQVSVILHHPSVKSLEAKWRGLHDLVYNDNDAIYHTHAVKILCITVKEFTRDLGRTSDFEQTHLFKIIYSHEYDMSGGVPFGLMLIDLEMSLARYDDAVTVLENIMAIGGAAFLPFIMTIQPDWFQLSSYQDFARINEAHAMGSGANKIKINRLRSLEDARYLFFVCQRCLWREPYQHRYQSSQSLSFYESIAEHEDLCWGSVVYLVARLVLINFHRTGWFSDINQQSLQLDSWYLGNDFAKTTPLPRLELSYFNAQSHQLSKLGCLTLQEHPLSRAITIDRSQAWHQPSQKASNKHLQQSLVCALTYLLCACRFAHYLKILGREKIGSFINAEGLQSYLQQWIFQYCGQSEQFNKDQWIKYPLRSASIEIIDQPHLPGHYICRMDLKPNFRIDQVDSNLKLVSMIGRSRLS